MKRALENTVEKGENASKHPTILILTILMKRTLENTVEKGENADKQHFLLFPQSFLLSQREKSSF